MQYWIENAVDRAVVDWKKDLEGMDCWDSVWWQMEILLEDVLGISDDDRKSLPRLDQDIDQYLCTATLDQFHQWMQGRIGMCLERYKNGIPVREPAKQFYGLLQWTDEAEHKFVQSCREASQKFCNEYWQFVNLDAVIFPPDFLSNLKDFNEVRLMRIGPSPSLEENGNGIGFWANKGAAEKLAGRGLAHFSGFLKRSWRSNDILWGRMDGLRHIVISLLAPDEIDKLRKDEQLKLKISANLKAMGGMCKLIREVFPDSPLQSQQQLADFFEQLLSPGDEPLGGDKEAQKAILRKNLNLLVEMGQLEVLYDELPEVLRDAAAQQSEWNSFQRRATRAAPPNSRTADRDPGFLSPVGYVDPSLVAFYAESELTALTAEWKRNAASGPKSTPIGKYFEQNYQIANEGVERGLPPLVAAQYVTHSALVANNCVLGALKRPLRDRVTSNPIYKLGVRLPLRLSHGLLGIWIRGPKTLAITFTFLVTAALVAWTIAFFWRTELFKDAKLWTWALLVFLPLVLLLLGCFFVWFLWTKTDYWLQNRRMRRAGVPQ